jgi:hypothetical protein
MIRHLTLFLFSLFLCIRSYGQTIPSDSLLLATVFGYVDTNKTTTTKQYDNAEYRDRYNGKLTYSIIFKKISKIENEHVLVVVCRATCCYMHGHAFGLTNTYLLKHDVNKWNIVYANIESEDNIAPVGDDNKVELVKIGNSKTALIYPFLSTGNNHLERNITIYLLRMNNIIEISTIDLDYSNEAWIDAEAVAETDSCMIKSYESNYQIIKSEKNWYDIKVLRLVNGYGMGYKGKNTRQEEVVYSYIDGEYKKRTEYGK